MSVVTRCSVAFTVMACTAVAAAADGPSPEAPERTDSALALLLREPDVLAWKGADSRLRVGGRLALDYAVHGHANRKGDDLLATDGRLVLDGAVGPAEFRIEPDLVGDDTDHDLWEAWLRIPFDDSLRVTGGLLRVPLASEFATREEHLPAVGYGYPTHLDGRHDVGVRLDGALWEDRLWYEATAVSGHGFGLEGHPRTSEQLSLRLAGQPLRGLVGEDGVVADLADGFVVGVAFAELSSFDDALTVSTPLESRTFQTRDLGADGGGWTHFELAFHHGPARLGFERTIGRADDVQVGGGATADMDQFTAFAFHAAWNLTGERQSWKRGRWVSAPADSEGHAVLDVPGRLEAAARYSNADMDRDLFDAGLTTFGESTQEVRTLTLNVNWYPEPGVRVSLGWVNTIADDDLPDFGGRKRDSAFVLRLDLTF